MKIVLIYFPLKMFHKNKCFFLFDRFIKRKTFVNVNILYKILSCIPILKINDLFSLMTYFQYMFYF